MQMNKKILDTIKNHCDKDEIISKLVIGISTKDIADWLEAKYTAANDKKFVITEKNIKLFKDEYLDIYNMVQADISKTKSAIITSSEKQLALSVQNNPTYKSKMLELAGKEIDVRNIIANLCVAVESRLAQVFDKIQEDPDNINTRIDRLLIDYAETLGNILEKYYKFTEMPQAQVINNNVTLQVVDQHITVFHDVIKDILSNMDLDTSLYFMEVFNEKMSKLKETNAKDLLNTDAKLVEARLLNDTINTKINE